MGTWANSEDPDEMQQNAAFHKGLHCLKQVAQWATIAHLGASIMFGDTMIDDAQRLVNLNLKQ